MSDNRYSDGSEFDISGEVNRLDNEEYRANLKKLFHNIDICMESLQDLGDKYGSINIAVNLEKANRIYKICGFIALLNVLFLMIMITVELETSNAQLLSIVVSIICGVVIYVFLNKSPDSELKKAFTVSGLGTIGTALFGNLFIFANSNLLYTDNIVFMLIPIVFLLVYAVNLFFSMKREKKIEKYLKESL